MKDSLIDVLLTLFEKTLAKLIENSSEKSYENIDCHIDVEPNAVASESLMNLGEISYVQAASTNSSRVFTYEEQNKLTKSSYQLLVRMVAWKIIAPEAMELVLSRLMRSNSSYISTEETKEVIWTTLSDHLDDLQLAFLELVLYGEKGDESVH